MNTLDINVQNIINTQSRKKNLGQSTYWTQIKKAYGAGNILAYWPLNETSGTVAYDLSGNGYNAAYHGVLALNQSGANKSKSVDMQGTGDINIYSESLANVFNGNEGYIEFSVKTDGTQWLDSTKYLFWIGKDSNNCFALKGSGTGNLYFQFWGGGTYKSTNVAAPYGSRFFRIGCRWSKVNDKIDFFLNGKKQVISATATVGLGTFSGPIGANLAHFFADNTVSNKFDAYVQDILILKSCPTDQQILDLFKPTGITVFEGDSRTATLPWPSKAMELASTLTGDFGWDKRTIYNPATVGGYVTHMTTRAASVNAQMISGSTKNTLVVWIGVNGASSKTALQIYNDIKTYCQAAKTAGWNKIVLCTEIDAQDTIRNNAGWHTTKLPALNDLIRGDHSFVDAIADLAADARLMNALDQNYFNSDFIHPNAAGSDVAQSIITPVLRSVA